MGTGDCTDTDSYEAIHDFLQASLQDSPSPPRKPSTPSLADDPAAMHDECLAARDGGNPRTPARQRHHRVPPDVDTDSIRRAAP